MADLLKMQQKEIVFYDLDQDKRLQALAPNAVTGKLLTQPQQIVLPFILKISIPVNSKKARLNLPGITTPPSAADP